MLLLLLLLLLQGPRWEVRQRNVTDGCILHLRQPTRPKLLLLLLQTHEGLR